MKKRIIACIAAALMTLACVGCNKAKEPVWADTVPRPDIGAPSVAGGYVKYPDAPESAPAAPDTGRKPSVSGYASHGKYTVDTQGEYPVISYDGIDDWDYVYATVDNYHAEYGNIIITVNAPTAEKIIVQALYYEMYTDGNRAVTVYSGDLGGSTDRRLIARLDRFTKLNSEWDNMGSGNSLENAKIIGFAIFIDSSPVQVVSDRKGSVTVKSFEFVKDDDPGLEMQYIVPSANYDGSATNESSGYVLDKITDAENPDLVTGLKVSYNGVAKYSQVYIPIMDKDSVPDYAEFSIKLNTSGVGAYAIGVMFSNGGNSWQNYVEMIKVADATDGEHEHVINFDGTQPISTTDWSVVPGEFIKNYGVYQICLWFDSLDGMEQSNAGEAVISDIVFARTATDGATVGKAWSTTIPSNMTISDNVELGGKGTVTYSWYKTWYYLSMPVSGYKPDAPKSKLTIEFVCEDIDRFGVAVVASNVKQNNGEAVLCSTWDPLAATENGASGTDSAAYGTTYKAVKDGNKWTLTFDFSKAKKQSDGNAFWEATVTAVRIYLNDPSEAQSGFAGQRTIEFLSVAFDD